MSNVGADDLRLGHRIVLDGPRRSITFGAERHPCSPCLGAADQHDVGLPVGDVARRPIDQRLRHVPAGLRGSCVAHRSTQALRDQRSRIAIAPRQQGDDPDGVDRGQDRRRTGVVGGGPSRLDDEVDGFERRLPVVGALIVLAGTDDDGRARVETGDGRHGATVGGAWWLPTIAASTSPLPSLRVAIGSDHAGLRVERAPDRRAERPRPRRRRPRHPQRGTRSTIRPSAPASHERWCAATPTAASCSAGAARGSRWLRTRCGAHGPRSATICSRRGCRGRTTTPTCSRWVDESWRRARERDPEGLARHTVRRRTATRSDLDAAGGDRRRGTHA